MSEPEIPPGGKLGHEKMAVFVVGVIEPVGGILRVHCVITVSEGCHEAGVSLDVRAQV